MRAGSTPPPWADVAAPGTDPARLAGVVTRALRDRRGLEGAWRDGRGDGLAPAALVDRLLAAPVLPGDAAAVGRVVAAWADAGVQVALAGDPAMPTRLAHAEVVPPWLAVRASVPRSDPPLLPDGPAVAIVGSRAATAYGRGLAAWLAETAGDAGVRVVSGGAVGVDAAAHLASHDRPGGTTVVLGCGHAGDYPRPHARTGGLFDRVVGAGGHLVSEVLPADPPRPHRVRARNRLVAALADAVVVVEGGARSGSLVTATWAAELGVPVLAVPGDVRAPGSSAPHRLLREGAAVCTGPPDLLEQLAGGPSATARVESSATPHDGDDGHPGVPAWLHDPLRTAWPRALPLAHLVGATGRDPAQVLAAVTRGQVAGLLTRGVDGVRLCRRPAQGTG